MPKKCQDMTGKKFGKVTILYKDNTKKWNAWIGQCECGTIKSYRLGNLNHEHLVSCGCAKFTWSEEDKKFLKQNYHIKGVKYCSERLNRKPKTVKEYARKLGIAKVRGPNRPWKDWEIEFLIDNYNIYHTLSELSYILDRCDNTILSKAKKLNIDIYKRRKDNRLILFQRRRGKNSPRWNSTKTDEERIKHRTYDKYNEWRKKVYNRDNYTCQICGKQSNLVAHHLDGYHWCKRRRFDVDNGVCLCGNSNQDRQFSGCHDVFHKIYGRRNNTKEQFKEFYKQTTGKELSI